MPVPSSLTAMSRDWYFNDGSLTPELVPRRKDEMTEPHLYPEERPGSDRVVDQLMYVPGPAGDNDHHLKTILLWNGLGKNFSRISTHFAPNKIKISLNRKYFF